VNLIGIISEEAPNSISCKSTNYIAELRLAFEKENPKPVLKDFGLVFSAVLEFTRQQ
jgi:hypothetical protein